MSKKPKAHAGGAFEALRPLRERLAREAAAKTDKSMGASGARPAPPPVKPASKVDARDADVRRRAYAGVAPLDRAPSDGSPAAPGAAAPGARSAPAGPAKNAIARARLRELAFGATPFQVLDEGDRVEGRRVDVPAEMLRKLRRGTFPIDARIDLHGQSAAEARSSLEAFLRAARGQRERCVLVIHGKGLHTPQGIGVLRGEVAAWLSQGPSSEHVAAFATAQNEDGGGGAAYVLLRR